MVTSKNSQIRTLIVQGKLNRAQIAREVGCSYQYVRNEQVRMDSVDLEPYLRDPVTSDVTDCTLTKPKRAFGLWEETWRPH